MGRGQWISKLAAAATVAAVVGVFALAIASFAGDLSSTVPLSIVAQRAGLVMDPGAKVELRGVTIGTVSGIDDLPGGLARLSLKVQPSALDKLPSNSRVKIASSTVFGAKYVIFQTPPDPAPTHLTAGARILTSDVEVELNTVFEQLTQVLDTVEPSKLDATLTTIARTLDGRGEALGTALVQADDSLRRLNADNPSLAHDLAALAPVTGTYAAAGPNIDALLSHSTSVSKTIVDERKNLDLLLLNTTGLANTGNAFLAANTKPLATALNLLTPTTALLAEYSPGIPCLFEGLDVSSKIGNDAYASEPGVRMSFGLLMGVQPYRYPDNLPKVAASGGPQCLGLPNVDPKHHPPYLVTDTGVNPLAPDRQGPAVHVPNLMSYLFGVALPERGTR